MQLYTTFLILGFEHDSTSVKLIDLETKLTEKFAGIFIEFLKKIHWPFSPHFISWWFRLLLLLGLWLCSFWEVHHTLFKKKSSDPSWKEFQQVNIYSDKSNGQILGQQI